MSFGRAWVCALLLFVLVCCGFADPVRDEVLRLDQTTALNGDFADKIEKLDRSEGTAQTKSAISDYLDTERTARDRDQLIGDLTIGRWTELPFNEPEGSAKDSAAAAASASRIKEENFVADPSRGQAANWLGKSLKDLQDLLNGIETSGPGGDMPSLSLPTWLVPLAWSVLAGILAGLITWLVMNFVKGRGRRVARTSLLAEDEEVLQADEYLAQGDKAVAEHRYAEAVRMFYLAMLVRLHEGEVLEFRRFETNWEHFRRFRFEQGSSGASGFALRDWTLLFDYIWYGHRDETAENAQRFRGAYQELLGRLRGRAA